MYGDTELHLLLNKRATLEEQVVLNLLWNIVSMNHYYTPSPFQDTGQMLWVRGKRTDIERLRSMLEHGRQNPEALQRCLHPDEADYLIKFGSITNSSSAPQLISNLMRKVGKIVQK